MVRKFENPSDEINLNTLAIISLLGLLILFGTYFAFYDPEKYMYRPIRYVQHLVGYVQPSVEHMYHSIGYVQHSVKNSLVGCVQRSVGYVQRSVKYVQYLAEHMYEHTYRSICHILSFIKNIPRLIIKGYTFLKGCIRNNLSTPINRFYLDNLDILSCADCTVTAQFEKENNLLKVEYKIPHNKGRLNIFFHKIFERIFDIPVDYGWVSMNSEIPNADWSGQSSVNFFVKGGGAPSRLEFSVTEADGDVWYFFDKEVLKIKNEVLMSMPFKDFVHPSWAPLGDGKKEFRNVTMFQITITSFDKAVNNTLYFKLKEGSLIYLE